MKNLFQILILITFLVVPTQKVFACGNSASKAKSEKSSCSKEKHNSKKSCCNKNKTDKNKNSDCDGKCNNSSCQNYFSSNFVVVLSSFEFVINRIYFELKNPFIFNLNFTQQLSSSIWQPPKIG